MNQPSQAMLIAEWKLGGRKQTQTLPLAKKLYTMLAAKAKKALQNDTISIVTIGTLCRETKPNECMSSSSSSSFFHSNGLWEQKG
jgi:hypothetical protein